MHCQVEQTSLASDIKSAGPLRLPGFIVGNLILNLKLTKHTRVKFLLADNNIAKINKKKITISKCEVFCLYNS